MLRPFIYVESALRYDLSYRPDRTDISKIKTGAFCSRPSPSPVKAHLRYITDPSFVWLWSPLKSIRPCCSSGLFGDLRDSHGNSSLANSCSRNMPTVLDRDNTASGVLRSGFCALRRPLMQPALPLLLVHASS